MASLRLLLAAYWPVVFREPRVFDIGVYGPGAAGSSMAYPLPSTVAGIVASIAFERGLCNPPTGGIGGSGVFDDTAHCVEQLLGEGFHLYTGLAQYRGNVYAYTGAYLVRLEKLVELLAEKAKKPVRVVLDLQAPECCPEDIVLRPGRERRTGIGLNRATKTASLGLIYSLEYIGLQKGKETVRLLAFAETKGDAKHLVGRYAVKLGGENRPGILDVEEAEKPYSEIAANCREEEGNRVLLFLVSPAILERSPWENGVVDVTTNAAKRLAEMLLQGLPLQPVRPYLATTRPIEAVMPGWSMAWRRHRRPVLLVPPGTVIVAKPAGEEDACRAAREAAEKGVGEYRDLGWGSVVAVAAKA